MNNLVFAVLAPLMLAGCTGPDTGTPPPPPGGGGASPPATPTRSPYPVNKKVDCGSVNVFVASGLAPVIVDGAIVFDFKADSPPTCDCTGYGWIQHVATAGTGVWRYDNGTLPKVATGGRQGGPSNPSASTQPTSGTDGGNPWYGASASGAAGFGQNPTPQERIGDKPDAPNTQFVTQVVCIPTGKVLFSWQWGPFDGSQPLDSVPAKEGLPSASAVMPPQPPTGTTPPPVVVGGVLGPCTNWMTMTCTNGCPGGACCSDMPTPVGWISCADLCTKGVSPNCL